MTDSGGFGSVTILTDFGPSVSAPPPPPPHGNTAPATKEPSTSLHGNDLAERLKARAVGQGRLKRGTQRFRFNQPHSNASVGRRRPSAQQTTGFLASGSGRQATKLLRTNTEQNATDLLSTDTSRVGFTVEDVHQHWGEVHHSITESTSKALHEIAAGKSTSLSARGADKQTIDASFWWGEEKRVEEPPIRLSVPVEANMNLNLGVNDRDKPPLNTLDTPNALKVVDKREIDCSERQHLADTQVADAKRAFAMEINSLELDFPQEKVLNGAPTNPIPPIYTNKMLRAQSLLILKEINMRQQLLRARSRGVVKLAELRGRKILYVKFNSALVSMHLKRGEQSARRACEHEAGEAFLRLCALWGMRRVAVEEDVAVREICRGFDGPSGVALPIGLNTLRSPQATRLGCAETERRAAVLQHYASSHTTLLRQISIYTRYGFLQTLFSDCAASWEMHAVSVHKTYSESLLSQNIVYLSKCEIQRLKNGQAMARKKISTQHRQWERIFSIEYKHIAERSVFLAKEGNLRNDIWFEFTSRRPDMAYSVAVRAEDFERDSLIREEQLALCRVNNLWHSVYLASKDEDNAALRREQLQKAAALQRKKSEEREARLREEHLMYPRPGSADGGSVINDDGRSWWLQHRNEGGDRFASPSPSPAPDLDCLATPITTLPVAVDEIMLGTFGTQHRQKGVGTWFTKEHPKRNEDGDAAGDGGGGGGSVLQKGVKGKKGKRSGSGAVLRPKRPPAAGSVRTRRSTVP